MTENEIATRIINSAFQIHQELGPGLLESAYEACLLHELNQEGLRVKSQVNLPLVYKGQIIPVGYRLDLWVEEKVIVELKTVSSLEPIFTAQLLTYLKLTNNKLGLLINFNVPLIKNGIKRLVNGL